MNGPLIDDLKAAGEHATAAARESLRDAQLGQELARAYAELGRMTLGLIEQGSLGEEQFGSQVQAIRDIQRRLAAYDRGTDP